MKLWRIKMENYQKLYAKMIDAAEKAIEEIEQQNYGRAKSFLINAEQECEEWYLDMTAQIETQNA